MKKSAEVKKHAKAIEGKLARDTPELLRHVIDGLYDAKWEQYFAQWNEAWNWLSASDWLEKRSNFEYQESLWRKHNEVDEEISRLLSETVALKAWKHFFKRLSPRESAALKSWREAVRAMGKGTGKSAKMARLRREARQYMDACRDAIPIWVMPRYLVAEMVDPGPGRYDLVIVDEASQLGIESLFLFYIAKKIIVVGDDQQISPYGIGVADEAIAGLQQHYLDGIPHHHALSAQASLYGNAKIRFSQNIVLREHFRCMPEIIQFSNDLCYASNGTPLDPLRAYPANRLDPLVLRHVKDGYRKGTSQHAQNEPEADAIVAQIAGCIEDPRYKGMSMGVISLQGETQAKLIEQKLLKVIDPEVIEERNIVCGDAYAFQGDERHVIFLSMVAAPGEIRIGTLSGDAARQRFNVAVSRAQDQLWLFHTATLDVLSPSCMRHKLLSYMVDPRRKASNEEEQRFDSEFEREVFRRITDRGFHVRTQVCVGDPTNHRYRIDLVVEGMQGRLAVECDGDRWHGPDRYEQDMARQRDLERAGWQFIRIRGGDFYRDPDNAMEPLWIELERMDIRPGGIDDNVSSVPEPIDNNLLEGLEELDENANGNEPAAVIDNIGAPNIGTPNLESIQTQNLLDVALPDGEIGADLFSDSDQRSPVNAKVGSGGQVLEGEGTSDTRTSSGDLPYPIFDDPLESDPRSDTFIKISKDLCKIIDVEGPMLAKRAYDVYLRGCGIKRLGGDLKKTLNKALQHAINQDRVEKEDEMEKGGLLYTFVRKTSSAPVLVRARGPRELAEIPPSEILVVAKRLVKKHQLELGSEEHLRAILDYFELKRLTAQSGTLLLDILEKKYPYVD